MNENMTCMECGCIDEELFELEIDGEIKMVCADCARRLGFVQCSDCGKWIPEEDSYTVTYEGRYICEDCYSYDYSTCEDCGAIVHSDDLIRVNQDTRSYRDVCDRCADRWYYKCDDCGRYYDRDHIHIGENDVAICDDCWDNGNWVCCEDCSAIISYDDAHYCESDGCYYCDDCISDHESSEYLHDYGYKPDPEFQFQDDEHDHDRILTFGVELEVDYGDDSNDLVNELTDLDQPIYMKHDGSLDPEGVEIVTHPCSLAYHMNGLDWESITRTCVDNGYKSHDTTTCGLHIHVGRQQFGDDDQERRRVAGNLVLLAYSLWDELARFSRREIDRLEHWAKRPKLSGIWSQFYTDSELTDIALATIKDGRYQAVNLRNLKTVEFRIFRGTLRPGTILASVQLIDTLTHYAMTHTPTECLNAEWADVIGDQIPYELENYCQSRGLL